MSISLNTRVRYIKLGRGGSWEHECIANGVMRFGFHTGSEERYPLCRERRWNELRQSFVAAGTALGQATQFTNQTRIFFEDTGDLLWITFVGDHLCWGATVLQIFNNRIRGKASRWHWRLEKYRKWMVWH